MARYLFTTWPFTGHIHANVTVARELRRRGHEVAFYTGNGARVTVEAEGFDFFPFQKLDEAHVERLVLGIDGITSVRLNLVKLLSSWREFLVGTVPDQLSDLEPIVDSWRPEVIVCDPCLWAPPLVLHEAGRLPVAMLLYVTACLLPGPDGPLLGLPLPRPHSRLTAVRNRAVRTALTAASYQFRAPANAIRRSYGLPPLRTTVTEYMGGMSLYLVTSIPELDYSRTDLPPTVRYVGALPWKPSRDEAMPEWLAALPTEQPIVYVTEGTAQPQEPVLLRSALTGLADAPVQVIASTGPLRSPADLGLADLPANVRLERWVPHHHLIPRISLLVSSGGNGTVMAALQQGVPLVVVPMHWEQEETAWRVADAGVGLRLGARECTPSTLRSTVMRVLNDPTYRRNAGRIAEKLRAAPGPQGAADLLESLLPREGRICHDPCLSAMS